ncbi:MAG: hypothetical protein JSR80_05005 [Verrucomicrobia bacterium]|nr:hypothetical protein [Verrucomicrobiota bacterium]
MKSNDSDRVIPTVDSFLGLQYARPCCRKCITAYAGWEQHTFFSFNHLTSLGGNFSTQGLSLGIDVGF